jgi:hypothetical protein
MKKRYLFIVSIALVGTITATSAKAIDLSGIISSALNSTGIIQGIQASLPAPISNYVLKAIGVEGSAASYSSSPGDFQEAVGALVNQRLPSNGQKQLTLLSTKLLLVLLRAKRPLSRSIPQLERLKVRPQL